MKTLSTKFTYALKLDSIICENFISERIYIGLSYLLPQKFLAQRYVSTCKNLLVYFCVEGNPHIVMKTIDGNWSLSGEPSMQNALQLAMSGLK